VSEALHLEEEPVTSSQRQKGNAAKEVKKKGVDSLPKSKKAQVKEGKWLKGSKKKRGRPEHQAPQYAKR